MNKDRLSKVKNDMNRYLPTLVLWAIRFFLTIQSYMYHSSLGYYHLIFILSTFILPGTYVLLLSFVVMLPLYFAEFVLLYGMRIPLVNQTDFLQTYGKAFESELMFPIFEQFLLFL